VSAAAPPEEHYVGLEGAKKLKEKANQEFLAERYDQALELYEKALTIIPEEEK
jgi:tetratricopeptide (TPR) repeat protein